MNGLQMLSDSKIKAAGADWKGGLDRLPDGIKNVAEGLPPDRAAIPVGDRQDLAAIMMKGSPEFMHGTDLNRSVLTQTEQLLQGAPDGTYKQGWEHSADLALTPMLAAAGRDQWAVHDLVAGVDGTSPNNEFISNTLRHQWDDDGAAAATMMQGLAPVATDATQLDAATRAGETVHAFDKYIADHPTEFTNMRDPLPLEPGTTGTPLTQDQQTFGEAHPALVQALAEANAPFLDDMMKHDLNSTHGFGELDDSGDANMPHTRDLLSALNSDPIAAETMKGAVQGHHLGFQQDYVNSLADHDTPDVDALRADGQLQGLNDVAASQSTAQQEANDYAQAVQEHEQNAARYEALTTVGDSIPGVSNVLDGVGNVPGADSLMEDMLGAGESPTSPEVPHIPLQEPGPNQYHIAEQLYAKQYGDHSAFPNGFPTYDEYMSTHDGEDIRNDVTEYLGDDVRQDLDESDKAYDRAFPHNPGKAGQ